MASDDLEKAKQAYREGRYAEAAARIEGLLRENPGEEKLWLMLERAYEKNGQREEAAQLAFFSPETLQKAGQERRPGETIGSALLRLNLETLDRMIDAVIGKKNLPTGYTRPFSERIGTLAAGKKQIILKQALGRQAHETLPLGALLERFGLSSASLRSALALQTPLVPTLAESDNLKAILKRWKVADQSPEVLERAKSYYRELARVLIGGKRRLGDTLVARGALTSEQLEKALAWQVDQPYPLGELLVQHRLCSPEEVIAALQEQLRGYREDVEAMLPPLPQKELADETEEETKDGKKILLWGGLAIAALVSIAFTLKPFVPLPWLHAREMDSTAPPPMDEGERGRLGEGTAPIEHKPLDPGGVDAVQLPNNYANSASAPSLRTSELRPSPLGSFEPQKYLVDPEEKMLSGSSEKTAFSLEAAGEKGNGLSSNPSWEASGFLNERSQETASPTRGEPARPAGNSKPSEGTFERQGATPRQARNGGKFEKLTPDQIRAEERRLGVVFQNKHSKEGAPPVLMDDEVKDGRNIKRNSAVFRARLAEARLRNKEVRSAAIEFLAAIALDPEVALPYYHLGTILEAEGDQAGARAHYERYLEYAPNSEYSDEARERLKKLKR